MPQKSISLSLYANKQKDDQGPEFKMHSDLTPLPPPKKSESALRINEKQALIRIKGKIDQIQTIPNTSFVG